MIPAPAPDPRLTSPPDTRIGRPILKALGRRKAPAPAPPTAKQAGAERPLWGPHPDPAIARIEEDFYGWGQRLLVGLLSGALGRNVQPRLLVKAGFVPLDARVSGWGKVMDLFKSDQDPAHLLTGWAKVLDKLTTAMVPEGSAEGAAQALALKSHLLFKVGQRVGLPPVLPSWLQGLDHQDTYVQASMEWTQGRALQYAANLSNTARHALAKELIASKQAGEGPGTLERRLLDQFGQLNRDWRKIALTETAFAVQNGALASVASSSEGWIATWIAAPTACPYCLAQHKKVFKVVPANKANKDGDTEVWVGKSNVGRAMAKYSKKEGHFRAKAELWWPCCPAHPYCACTFSLRPAKFAHKPFHPLQPQTLKGS